MGQVTIAVNGHSYRMSCADGAEARVAELAAHVAAHVDDLKGDFKQVQQERLYLMAAIMVADELWDAREALQQVLMQMSALRSYQLADGGAGSMASREIARIIETSSERLAALLQRRDSGGE